MFCPLKCNPTNQDCKECNNECLNFNLLIVCEHPDNGSGLIPRLNKLLVNQKKANVFINALETEINDAKDLLPKIDSKLQSFLESRDYNIIIYRSFNDEKYLDLIKLIISSTGGGVVIYGTPLFMYNIQRKFNELICTYKPNDQGNIIKKLKFRFVEEKVEKTDAIVGQQTLF